mgnify:FL=1
MIGRFGLPVVLDGLRYAWSLRVLGGRERDELFVLEGCQGPERGLLLLLLRHTCS